MIPVLFKCGKWTEVKHPKILIHYHVTFKGVELGLVVMGALFAGNYIYKKIKSLKNKKQEIEIEREIPMNKEEESIIIRTNFIEKDDTKEIQIFKKHKIILFSASLTNVLAFGKIMTLDSDTQKKFAYRIYQNPRLHELDSYMIIGGLVGVVVKYVK